ncbi:MAG: c-type cytochrome [Acetobacterales bacterium]
MVTNRILRAAMLLAAFAVALPALAQPADGDAVARGEYVFHAAGCESCHTDRKGGGASLAGGRALETPFGTFYAPNITPHPEYGIGRWTVEDLIAALHRGVSPGGAHFFPAFPYPSYTQMSEADIRDLWAWLQTVEPADTPNRAHDVPPPFGWRFLAGGWKWMFFEPGRFEPDPGKSAQWNRGAYLVRALAHCGECHTPRNFLGGRKDDYHLAGNPHGAGNEPVPNITPHDSGIAGWSEDDIATYLDFGMTPDGDFAGGAMAEVIEHGTGNLSDDDRAAIAAYLKDIPALPSRSE